MASAMNPSDPIRACTCPDGSWIRLEHEANTAFLADLVKLCGSTCFLCALVVEGERESGGRGKEGMRATCDADERGEWRAREERNVTTRGKCQIPPALLNENLI